MKKSQRIILLLILIFGIIILSLVYLLYGNKQSEYDANKNTNFSYTENNNIIENEYSDEINDEINDELEPNISTITYDKKLEYVKDRTNYYTVSKLYNDYIQLLSNKEYQKINNILSNQYKNKYNINSNNIYYNLSLPSLTNNTQYYKTTITEMLTTHINANTLLYIIKGNYRIVNMDDNVHSIELMIEMDIINKTYIIYPEQYMKDNKYDVLKNGDIVNYVSEEIKENDNNKFYYLTKTDREMANEYFNNFVELMIYYKNEAYQKLNSDYAKSRFGSKEAFIKYIENNKSNIALMKINRYRVYSSDNYTDYICTDQYNNYYIFRQQNGVMNYTVFLDTYTIEIEAFKKAYENATGESKIVTQVEKIAEMINRKDYNALYNKLNLTFKQNNFNSVSKLQDYIENNMYEMNEIKVNSINLNDDYYICECTLSNLRATDQSKSMNMIIKLVDYSNFEISFSFN